MILVTGASGYIGSHICHNLYHNGRPFIGIDRDIHKNIIPNVQYHLCDCCDKDRVLYLFKKFKPEYVIHLAALKSIPESLTNPELYLQNNINCTTNVLLACKKFFVKKLIFSSTCAVYGNAKSPIQESAPLNPLNPYAISKAICEQIIQTSGTPYIILRYFNPIGEINGLRDLSPDSAQYNIRSGDFTIYGSDYDTPDGTPIRDFIGIAHLIKRHLLAIDLPVSDGIFNIGAGVGKSVKQLCTECGIKYKLGPRRAGDIAALWADVTKWKETIKS